MRVLLVTPGLPPDKTGGIENVVQQVRKELIARGHSVTVLTALHKMELKEPGVVQVRVPTGGEIRGYARWAASAWLRAMATEHDLTHFNGFPGQILSLAPSPHPKIVHMHNSLSMEPEWWNGARHGLGHLIVSESCRRASMVVAPTAVVKQDVIGQSHTEPSKIRVIPNCVDTRFYDRSAVPPGYRDKLHLDGKFTILYFGKIKKTKGIETLCKAYYIVKRKIDAALIVGGSIAATDTFLQYLRKAYPEVIFTGFVQDPRPYYASADVFSINTPGFSGGETFAISLAEAMSMGLPVVCSDNPIFREVTKGNALFAKPEDEVSLAEKILELAGNPEVASAMGRRGREIAKAHYDIPRVVDMLEEAYLSLVSVRN
jgi:glycosyltransferase involved in cell wall biosynthesis